MFHHVNFDGRQRRTRLIGHGVHAEVECRIIRDQTAHLEPRIVAEMRGHDVGLPSGQQRRSAHTGKRLVRLLDDGSPGRTVAADAGCLPGRDAGKAARLEHIRADADASFEHVDKSLIAAGGKRAATLELGGVLHECRPAGRRRVHDRRRVPHAGQRRTDKGLRRLEAVIVMIGASTWQIHAGGPEGPPLHPRRGGSSDPPILQGRRAARTCRRFVPSPGHP